MSCFVDFHCVKHLFSCKSTPNHCTSDHMLCMPRLLPTLDLVLAISLSPPHCVELAVSQMMNKHKTFLSAADWSRDVFIVASA